MQAAVPFTWEEWPGKPKGRSLEPCASTGNYDFKNTCSLQDHFLGSGKVGLNLAPPPGQQQCALSSAMSTSSNSSGSGSSEFDSTTVSSGLDSQLHEDATHEHNRSVTLLDLMRAARLQESGAASKTLGSLFSSDSVEAKPPKPKNGSVCLNKHQAGAPCGAGHGKKGRRNSYLPYKQGLISIFCMSPCQEELVLMQAKNRNLR